MRLMGLDPGLRVTGWGVIDVEGNRLRHAGNGVVRSDGKLDTAARLVQLFDGISRVFAEYKPDETAVEETFVNRNPDSTLKLGLARGVVLLVPARAGFKVSEYAPNLIKKSVVGYGHAAKEQVAVMVRTLLPGAEFESADAVDALAVAICHAHHTAGRRRTAAGDRDEAGAAGAPAARAR